MKKMFKAKKGQGVLNALVVSVIGLAVLAIILGVASDILTDINEDQTTDSYADNATEQGLVGLNNVANDQDTLGTVIVAGALIAIVASSFAFFRG